MFASEDDTIAAKTTAQIKILRLREFTDRFRSVSYATTLAVAKEKIMPCRYLLGPLNTIHAQNQMTTSGHSSGLGSALGGLNGGSALKVILAASAFFG
jgi:hypothetical protein